jgi:hypothetical protein
MLLPNPQPTFYNYVDDILDIDGSIYLDPHDHGGNLEHSIQPFIKLRCHQLGVPMSIWKWDSVLWTSFLDYIIEACTYAWDISLWMSFVDYFNIPMSTYKALFF